MRKRNWIIHTRQSHWASSGVVTSLHNLAIHCLNSGFLSRKFGTFTNFTNWRWRWQQPFPVTDPLWPLQKRASQVTFATVSLSRYLSLTTWRLSSVYVSRHCPSPQKEIGHCEHIPHGDGVAPWKTRWFSKTMGSVPINTSLQIGH